MSIPYDDVPELSEGTKLRPKPSIDAGPLGREIRVESIPDAWATTESVQSANAAPTAAILVLIANSFASTLGRTSAIATESVFTVPVHGTAARERMSHASALLLVAESQFEGFLAFLCPTRSVVDNRRVNSSEGRRFPQRRLIHQYRIIGHLSDPEAALPVT
jgi:hypothetical protein